MKISIEIMITMAFTLIGKWWRGGPYILIKFIRYYMWCYGAQNIVVNAITWKICFQFL